MKISVVMCTYNGASYLREQLQSIKAQTRAADEIIICDDGSTDETITLLTEFARDVPFKVDIVQNAERLGSTLNFSKAIELSSGELIILTDQDDIWRNDKIHCIENAFLNDKDLACIFSDADLIDENGATLGKTLWQNLKFSGRKKPMVQRGQAFDLLLKGNFITGATMCLRSSWKSAVLPVPHGWVHDYWISLVVSACSKLQYIDAPLIRYRCHPQQQLGLRGTGKKGLMRLWHRFNTLESENYLQASQKVCELRNRLSQCGHEKYEARIAQCQKLSEHLVLRGELPKNRLKRIPAICKETVNGNYFRLSLGIKSIFRDLFSAL